MYAPASCLIRLLRRSFATLAVVTLSVSVVVGFSLAMPATSFAQASDAEYTVEQQKLNEKGVRAIISKDYALAIAVLEESAAIGELNVTYLNLGRAYQKIGECKSAREAYQRAKEAPKVRAPSPAVVSKKLDEYTAELATECEAKEAAALAEREADEASEAEKPAQPDGDAKADTEEADATSDDQKLADAEVEPLEPEQPATSSVWAWTTTASGVALMGAGVGALVWADGLRSQVSEAARNEQGYVTSMSRPQALDNQQRAETLDAVGIGMTIGGALLTTGGVYMLLSEDTEADTSVGLRTGAGGVGLVWTKQF